MTGYGLSLRTHSLIYNDLKFCFVYSKETNVQSTIKRTAGKSHTPFCLEDAQIPIELFLMHMQRKATN